MASEILTAFKKQIAGFELVPAGGGQFELTVDGELVYSKKELGRFPEAGEVMGLLRAGKRA